MRRRVFIIGLDGVSFNVLDPMIKKGLLPNFERLKNEGVYSQLKSTIPATTAPAWTSFLTGKNPGKHGIFVFLVPEPRGPDRILVSSRDIKSDTIWRILSSATKKIVAINVPMTYPPERVNGFIVPMWGTPLSSQYTYPLELEEVPEDYVKVWTGPPKKPDPWEDTKDFLTYIHESAETLNLLIMKLLIRYDWDCFMVTFIDTDDLQHVFPVNPEYVIRYFQRIDEIIGEILSKIDKDTIMVIMSDHGMWSNVHKTKLVQINYWLKQAGLIKFRGASKGKLSAHFYLRLILQRIYNFLGRRGLRIPRIFREIGEKSIGFFNLIDFQSTKAWSRNRVNGLNGIWINTEGERLHGIVKEGKDYEVLCDEIVKGLKGLKDPETGQQILNVVLKRDEAYWGEHSWMAPDIVYNFNKGFRGSEDIVDDKLIIDITPTSDHLPNGIFIARGQCIRRGVEVTDVNIMDLTPTILFFLDVPIPSDMDGKVLKSVFSPNSTLARRDIRFQTPSPKKERKRYVWKKEEKKEIITRLKALGYI